MHLAEFLSKIISSPLKLIVNLWDAKEMSVNLCVCMFFKYVISYSGYVASSDRLRANNQSDRMLRQLLVALFIVLTQNFFRAIGKKTTKSLSKNIFCPERGSNQKHSEYKTEANVVDLRV